MSRHRAPGIRPALRGGEARGPATPEVLAGLMVLIVPPRCSLGHTTASRPVISVHPRVDYRRLTNTGIRSGVLAPGLQRGNTMEFGVLGPLEVTSGGRSLAIGGARTRGVLALLLTNANAVVSADRLADELWPDLAPERAAANLQVRP